MAEIASNADVTAGFCASLNSAAATLNTNGMTYSALSDCYVEGAYASAVSSVNGICEHVVGLEVLSAALISDAGNMFQDVDGATAASLSN
jgi:hypothetical protein